MQINRAKSRPFTRGAFAAFAGAADLDLLSLNRHHALLAASLLFVCFTASLPAQQRKSVDTLVYDAQTRGPVPIPPSERNLQTVVAEPWFKASDQPMVLEGPCFDRNGNLLFSDVYEGRVLRLTPDR
jgi:lactonase